MELHDPISVVPKILEKKAHKMEEMRLVEDITTPARTSRQLETAVDTKPQHHSLLDILAASRATIVPIVIPRTFRLTVPQFPNNFLSHPQTLLLELRAALGMTLDLTPAALDAGVLERPKRHDPTCANVRGTHLVEGREQSRRSRQLQLERQLDQWTVVGDSPAEFLPQAIMFFLPPLIFRLNRMAIRVISESQPCYGLRGERAQVIQKVAQGPQPMEMEHAFGVQD